MTDQDPQQPQEQPAEEQTPREPISPEVQAQVDNLMRQASLAKIRGQGDLAEKCLAEAERLAPHAPTVLEAQGDALIERGQRRKAIEKYKGALAQDPSNVPLERKYAEAVLELSAWAGAFDIDAGPGVDTMASGKAAIIMNLFVPGLGQYVLGDEAKGIGMFAGVVVSWGIAFLIPDGLTGLSAFMGLNSARVPFNPVVLLPLAVAFFCHMWSIADAAALAKELTPRDRSRPTPPVDKNFEP